MSQPDSQACPFCAETIKPQAKLCPHCRQWLTIRSLRHPLMNVLVFGLSGLFAWLCFAIPIMLKFDQIMNPRPYYSEFSSPLKILDSQMHWTETKDGLRIYVTGIMTNGSPVDWRDCELECRFYDSNGAMIDADHRTANATISAWDDAAFRAAFIPASPTNDYASFKLSVSTARNTKSRF
jgi:hypothetical protein